MVGQTIQQLQTSLLSQRRNSLAKNLYKPEKANHQEEYVYGVEELSEVSSLEKLAARLLRSKPAVLAVSSGSSGRMNGIDT